MSGGEEMKVKTGHLVMWVQGLVLVLLCAKLGAGAILEKEGETGTAGEEAVQLTNAAKTETRRQILIRTGDWFRKRKG